MIEGIPVASLTPPTLLGIAILMLLAGKLWTNAAYQQKCQDAERWRLAYEAEKEARQTAEKQNGELLELARTTHSVMTALFQNSERIRQATGGDASALVPTLGRTSEPGFGPGSG